MQPEINHDSKLSYQINFLNSLKMKTAEEISNNLMDIFCIIGTPCILQSDNWREFLNKTKKSQHVCLKQNVLMENADFLKAMAQPNV